MILWLAARRRTLPDGREAKRKNFPHFNLPLSLKVFPLRNENFFFLPAFADAKARRRFLLLIYLVGIVLFPNFCYNSEKVVEIEIKITNPQNWTIVFSGFVVY